MDGTTVTTIRTSAASAVAVEASARPDSGGLAVLGSGVQAEAHVDAISRVLPLTQVRIWGRTPANATALVARLAQRFDFEVTSALDAEAAVAGADVVVGATTSSTPVLQVGWLAPGATVISVGSFAADRSEVPAELLRAAAVVVVDDVDTSLEHAGPVVAAIGRNLLDPSALVSLGQVVTGTG